MVCAILINKISVKCLPGLVHEVRHAGDQLRVKNVKLDKILNINKALSSAKPNLLVVK